MNWLNTILDHVISPRVFVRNDEIQRKREKDIAIEVARHVLTCNQRITQSEARIMARQLFRALGMKGE